jgi:hypothetical protein
MQTRLGLGEAAGIDLAARGEEDQKVDQLLIAVGHRRAVDQRAVDQLEDDVVVAGDDDVLHPVVIDQRLEPAEPEQRVEHRAGQGSLLRHRPGGPSGVDGFRERRLDEVEDDRAAHLLLSGAIEPATVCGDGLAELLGRLGP